MVCVGQTPSVVRWFVLVILPWWLGGLCWSGWLDGLCWSVSGCG